MPRSALASVKSRSASKPERGLPGHEFYCQSSDRMQQCADDSVALTVTSPPYWNAIDYDIHASQGDTAWHRKREYVQFGKTINEYLARISGVFAEVLRVTVPGGFCGIVIGTVLYQRRHYPVPMLVTGKMIEMGWEFHQDIIWNKVTAGVRRAGTFIQHRKPGYYYPNIMTEYVLVFRKPGDPIRGSRPTMEIDALFTRDIANNIWHIAPVPPRMIDHPCPFPEEIVRRLILLYSNPGDTILDPFLGSGQTAVAAERTERRCIGYDIERRYISLSRRRIQNLPPVRQFHLVPRVEKVPA